MPSPELGRDMQRRQFITLLAGYRVAIKCVGTDQQSIRLMFIAGMGGQADSNAAAR